tara:strand:- start:2019 stop:2372 length:354 start_codon:yes stop_codon:yes gene_type:complete
LQPAPKYAYVLGTNEDGKPTVVGPFSDKASARSGSGDLQGKRLFMLATRDHTKATQIIKAEVLRKTGKNSLALRRHKHDQRELVSRRRGSQRAKADNEPDADRGVIDDLEFDDDMQF